MIINKYRLSKGLEIPLSFSQQRIWFLQNLYDDNVMYNVGKCYRINGHHDMDAMQATLNMLAVRHEPLRSRLQIAKDGYPFQVVEKEPRMNIEYTDLRNNFRDDIRALASQIMQEAVVRPFNLCTENMLRVVSVKLSESESMLVFVMHHIISDYFSRRLFNVEFTALYAAIKKGDKLSLPPLKFQYSDFAKEQERLLTGGNIAIRQKYWRDFFSNMKLPFSTVCNGKTDNEPPSYESAWQLLPPDTVQECKIIADSQKSTLFTVVLTAIALLVSHLYRDSKVMLCIANANRQIPGTEQLVGCFFTNVIIALNIRPEQKIAELIHQVRETFLHARKNQDMPFEMFAEDLNMECTKQRKPPYRVYISYRNSADIEISLPNADLEPLDFSTGRNTHEDIVFNFWEKMSEAGLCLDVGWLCRTDVFDTPTIKKVLMMLEALLKHIVKDVQADVRSLQDVLAGLD
jgi:hypothetical protein